MSSEGGLLKPEKDFTKEVDKQLPDAEKLAKVRRTVVPLRKLPRTDANRPTFKPPSRSSRRSRSRPDK